MPFTFGDVILRVLENEDRLKLQKEQLASESAYRAGTLKNQQEENRLRAAQIAQQQEQFNTLQDEKHRENPDVTPSEYLQSVGLSPQEAKKFAETALKADTLASRHNNPLNIKYGAFAKRYGATEGETAADGGKFAKFPSVESGLTAASSLLQSSSYSGLTVDAAMKRWSNNGYGGEIAPELAKEKVGNLTDKELDDLVNKMAVREGSVVKGMTIGGKQISTPSDFLNTPMPIRAVGQIVDDILKKNQTDLTKEQIQTYRDLRLAQLNKEKQGQAATNLDKELMNRLQDVIKPLSSFGDLKIPEPSSPVGRLMDKIGAFKGGLIGPPGYGPSINDITSWISGLFEKSISKEDQAAFTEQVSPRLANQMMIAETTLNTIKDAGGQMGPYGFKVAKNIKKELETVLNEKTKPESQRFISLTPEQYDKVQAVYDRLKFQTTLYDQVQRMPGDIKAEQAIQTDYQKKLNAAQIDQMIQQEEK